MDEARTQAVKKIQDSSNVLVTVSSNPSVDQLAAAIGFTIVLNKLGKHATAVFSGKVPDTIEFLKPEDTLENNTDSLRDFIISLDKSKADKLRYKVEDKVVKIFITPYRTSIGQNDLEFSQGDFNVDAVLALGVHEQKDLDQAITAHGRILHDATIVLVNRDMGGSLGGINWIDNTASSLCEMLVAVSEQLKADVLDEQIATAFLTGIVAETQRFSNERTTSNTMNISARLMAAGANQQLVATKLQEDKHSGVGDQPHFDPLMMNELAHDGAGADDKAAADGALRIDHPVEPEPSAPPSEQEQPENPAGERDEDKPVNESKLILDPPTMGGTLTASHSGNTLDPSTDPLSLPSVNQPLLSHDAATAQSSAPAAEPDLPDLQSLLGPVDQPAPSEPPEAPVPSESSQTLTELEQSVGSPHLQQPEEGKPDDAKQPEDAEEPAKSGGMHVLDPLPKKENPLPALNADDTPEAPSVITPTEDTSQSTSVGAAAPTADIDEARDDVLKAINASTDPTALGPIEALNSQPVDLSTLTSDSSSGTPVSDPNKTAFNPDAFGIEAAGVTGQEFRMPENLVDPNAPLPPDPTASSVSDPTAPPPVPPPLMPPVPEGGFAGDDSNDSDQPPQINPFNLPPNS